MIAYSLTHTKSGGEGYGVLFIDNGVHKRQIGKPNLEGEELFSFLSFFLFLEKETSRDRSRVCVVCS
jgi:hypothetical protein